PGGAGGGSTRPGARRSAAGFSLGAGRAKRASADFATGGFRLCGDPDAADLGRNGPGAMESAALGGVAKAVARIEPVPGFVEWDARRTSVRQSGRSALDFKPVRSRDHARRLRRTAGETVGLG